MRHYQRMDQQRIPAVLLLLVGALNPHPTAGSGLMETLLDEFLLLNNERAAEVAALGNSSAKWKVRQETTKNHLAKLFYPLPNASSPPALPPTFKVTGSVHHASGFTMKKILYETRPGLFVTGSLWVPDGVEEAAAGNGAKAPAVLMTSGHSLPAWRSNGSNLCSGPPTNCTGADHNSGGGVPHPHTSFPGNPGGYQIVLWNLVRRGFVVMASTNYVERERERERPLPNRHLTKSKTRIKSCLRQSISSLLKSIASYLCYSYTDNTVTTVHSIFDDAFVFVSRPLTQLAKASGWSMQTTRS